MGLSEIALLYFGVAYVYGGNTVEQGFDCSGLVCEALRSVGKLDKRDMSAQMLWLYLRDKADIADVKKDSILFFGRDFNSISHIAIAINENQMIEAGGEGSQASDLGSVRIRPITWRKDFLTGIYLR